MKPSPHSLIHLWTPALHPPGGIQSYSRLLADTLQSMPGVSLRVFELPHPPSLSDKIRFLRQTRAALLREHPRLVWATHLALVHPARLLPSVPLWISAHGIECWHLRRRQDAAVLRRASRILPVSRFTRDRLLPQLPELAGRMVLFPNHVDSIPETLTSSDEARLRLGLPREVTLLLTVSRLRNDRYKGHRAIFAALQALGTHASGVHYAIAGDGDDAPALRAACLHAGLHDRVHFLGSLSDEQRRLAYDACDAFVMPSTGEGFGIVYLEALAHGKPVLAGSVDGSVDALEDCPGAILVNPRDPASVALGLASLLRRLRAGEPLWEPSTLRRYVLTRFGPQRLQEHLGTLLRDHLRNPPPCAA